MEFRKVGELLLSKDPVVADIYVGYDEDGWGFFNGDFDRLTVDALKRIAKSVTFPDMPFYYVDGVFQGALIVDCKDEIGVYVAYAPAGKVWGAALWSDRDGWDGMMLSLEQTARYVAEYGLKGKDALLYAFSLI